jgi:hypothetical protein
MIRRRTLLVTALLITAGMSGPVHAGESSLNTGEEGYVAAWSDDEVNGSPGIGGGCGYALIGQPNTQSVTAVITGGASSKDAAATFVTCTLLSDGVVVARHEIGFAGGEAVIAGTASFIFSPVTVCVDMFAATRDGLIREAAACAPPAPSS